MKRQSIILIVTALVASASFAQEMSTQKMTVDNGISSKGFRISLLKPVLEAELKASYRGRSISDSEKLDDALGFALGYASLPVQALGWTTNLAYMDITNGGTKTGLARVDGNLAYAFNSTVNAKGGLNLSKLTSGSNNDKLNPAIGFQGGVGFQVTQNFGLDLAYTQMNQSGSIDGINIDLKESGLEIGLSGTF